MLITNPRRKKQIEEFIDKDRAVMDEYYTIFDGKMTRGEATKLMRSLIKKDPDFYDSYQILVNILFMKGKNKEAKGLLKEAYQRAVKRIADSQGRWPKLMRWGFLENRHLMRIINRYGIYYWETGNTKEALFIFRKLLKACPDDNLGVRFDILAIHLGLCYAEWLILFSVKDDPQGLDALKMDEWFYEHAKKFPEDFHEHIPWEEA